MATERELKFSTLGKRWPTFEELEEVLTAGNYQLRPEGLRQHRDRYFDDATDSLKRAGVALRRRTGTGERLATLKTRGQVDGASHVRDELELPLRGSAWPEPIVARLDGLADLTALRSHVTLETERERFVVAHNDLDLAVLSFDDVRANRPGSDRWAHFREIEIEAIDETTDDELTSIAELLTGATHLTLNSSTKLERAEALLELGSWSG